MKRLFAPILLALPTVAFADISDNANACIDELISKIGNVGGEVLKEEWSQAGTLVRLRDANGAEYECIVWAGPEIADFRLVNGNGDMADDGGGAAPPVVSGDQRVSFDAGTSGTAISATLEPNTSVRYLLGASAEQFMNVSIGSLGGAIDYKILNPDGSELLSLIGSDTPYRGQLWQTGDHVIEVVNAGAQPVSFDIGVGIE